MTKNKFIQGSIIMIFMNFFTRIIGLTYDVSISKILGAEAVGLLQITSSALMTFLILPCSGIPTAITKLIARENSKKRFENTEYIFKSALFFNLCVSILISLILFTFADPIAKYMLKNKELSTAIYFMIPAVIILSLSGLYKSYFYGMQNMVTPSIAQVIEHFSRFILVFVLFFIIRPKTALSNTYIAILGIGLGEFFDLMWSMFSRKRIYKDLISRKLYKENYGKFLSSVLLTATPSTLSGAMGIILRFVDTIMIPTQLILSGLSNKEAISMYGRFTGMTMPLITLSFVVTSALVTNIIPSLSQQLALKRYKDMKRDINLALKITLLISLPLMTIYMFFSKPIGLILYNDFTVGSFLQILSLGTVFMALQSTFSGILYGLNKHLHSTIFGFITMIVRIIIIYSLVKNPSFGIYGVFIAFYASNAVGLILNIITTKSVLKFKFNFIDNLFKPLLGCGFIVFVLNLSIFDINNLQDLNLISLIISFLLAFISYILVLIITNALPIKTLKILFKSN